MASLASLSSSSCCTSYQNSFLSFNQTSGKVIRVVFSLLAVGGAITAHFFGQPLGVTLAIGLSPLPLFFTDLVIRMCRSSSSKPQGKELLEVVKKKTPLMEAACLQDDFAASCALLRALDEIKDINAVDDKGWTALDMVLAQHSTDDNCKKIIWKMITQGADPKKLQCSNFLLLHRLAFQENKSMVSILQGQLNFPPSDILAGIPLSFDEEKDSLWVLFLLDLIKLRDDFQSAICSQLGILTQGEKEKNKDLFKAILFDFFDPEQAQNVDILAFFKTQNDETLKKDKGAFCKKFIEKIPKETRKELKKTVDSWTNEFSQLKKKIKGGIF